MKEDGEIAGDGLHSSKRLRLSILRSQNRGRSRSRSDSAGPSSHGASTSSAAVNLPSVPHCSVQVGVNVNVRESSSIEAEPTSLNDYSCRHAVQNASLIGIVDDSVPGNEENLSGVSDTRQELTGAGNGLLHILGDISDDVTNQQLDAHAEAGNGLLHILGDIPDYVENQQREVHGRQLEHGSIHSTESIPAEPALEISPAITASTVVSPRGHDNSLSSEEDETNDTLQGVDVSGDGLRNHLEQEADVVAFQETESEVIPLRSQQQDEAFSHNVTTFGQSETLALGHTDVLETSLEIVDAHETENAVLHADARNPAIETIELSEDDVDAELADPALTASAFAEPRLTAEDFDAFAPDSHHFPQPVPKDLSAEAGTSNPERFGTQLDSEGTTCPICMEPWTSTGNHRICSLACGHLFGKSCIKRWLKLAGRKNGKCPHCNKRARAEDLRTLYVSRIAVVDGETQQYMEEAGLLRTENEQLKKQVVDLREEVRRTQTLFRALAGDQRDAFSMFRSSNPRPQDQRGRYTSENRRHSTAHHASRPAPHGSILDDHFSLQSGRSTRERPQVEHLLFGRNTEELASRSNPQDQQNWRRFDGRNSGESRGLEMGFVLQDEKSLNGAKVFDMDAQSHFLLVSGRPPDCETSSGLTKINLLALSEGECISLPFGTGAIRDIRIAPPGTRAPGRLALVASLGKKLSLFSLESSNVVTTCTLPNPSWACSWDPCDPNRVYTGLQNGTLLSFDLRQTSSPLDTLKGPNSTPIHTLQYVPEIGRATTHDDGTSGSRGGGLLSASSNTLLFWPGIDQPQEKRPVSISQPGGSSICVSVSYNAAVDVMVASFRPKPTLLPLNDGASASTPSTYSQADWPSQSASSVLPESASTASVSVHVPTHFSYVRTSRPAADNSAASGTNNTSWEQHGPMVGHKSQAVLSRTAIVNEWTDGRPSQLEAGDAREGCLFASGDEGSKSVWLWDLATPTAKQMLMSHPSPVLDVRTAHIAGVDLLGCISERTLQLYRRSSHR